MNTVVIVAAGVGARMSGERDKLLLEFAGKPVLAHTLERIKACDSVGHLVLVSREERREAFLKCVKSVGLDSDHFVTWVKGGDSRQDSVWNGVSRVPEGTEVVCIQDAARPFTRPSMIEKTIAEAREWGAAVLGRPMTDTLKETDSSGEWIERTLDRSRIWAVETPQTFRLEVIRGALEAVRQAGLNFTDDTAACEWHGVKVRMVRNEALNPKITVPGDLPFFEFLAREG